VARLDTGRFGVLAQQVQDYSHRSETRKRADDGRQRLRETNDGRGDRNAAEMSPVASCCQYVTIYSISLHYQFLPNPILVRANIEISTKHAKTSISSVGSDKLGQKFGAPFKIWAQNTKILDQIRRIT